MSPYVGVNGWHIFAYIPLEEGTPSNVIGVAEKAGSVGGEAIAGQVCSSTLSVLLPLRLHGAQVGRYPTSASSAGGKAGAPVSTGAMSLRSGGREVWCDSCSGHGWSAAWHVVLRCWAVGLLGCWAVGLLGCWAVGLLGCWAVGVLECWSVGVLECWSVGVLECWSVGVLECWSVGVLECFSQCRQAFMGLAGVGGGFSR
ncbi:hypothetical protein LOK82_03355 [Xylella fastidiosa subsp. multiplex]|uniref:Uncharacterized protein n=1 Tax=Xylella fastidiosa subsp. multiplex TaxID=644357 RepID=A0AAW6HSI2_XYLFS|nr:hypothetical protein [Xylella fastidiosa subsp. multiplex]